MFIFYRVGDVFICDSSFMTTFHDDFRVESQLSNGLRFVCSNSKIFLGLAHVRAVHYLDARRELTQLIQKIFDRLITYCTYIGAYLFSLLFVFVRSSRMRWKALIFLLLKKGRQCISFNFDKEMNERHGHAV